MGGKQLPKELDSLITQRYPNVSPGCVILVMKKGDTIYRKAFGLADMELNVPMQPGMIFRIGSITKHGGCNSAIGGAGKNFIAGQRSKIH